MASLLAASEPVGRKAWYMAAALAGLRKGDLTRLIWADIDFEDNAITVRDGKAKRTDVIPMHPQLAEELKCRRDAAMATPKAKVFPQTVTDLTRQKDFLRAGIAHEAVVTDNKGKPVMIGIGKWRRPLTRIACEDAEGRVIDLHAMRTTLGTNLARAGVAPQLAQRIMRHADYRTTHKHYTVLGLTDTAKAIERLPAIKQPSQQTAKANGTTGECLTDDPQQYPQQSGREVAQSGATRCDEPSKKPPSGGGRKSGGERTLRDRVRPNAALRNKAGEGARTLDIQLGRLNAQPTTTAESTANKQGCNSPSNTLSNAENSTPSDVDLCLVTQAWESLPKVVRAAIVGVVEGVTSNVRGK